MTIAALIQLTYIALDKEINESISKAEKEFENRKNTALLRIDSKLSVFVNTENTRPYKDYFNNLNNNVLPYDTQFASRYFQLSQDGTLKEPSVYKSKNFINNVEYLSNLCMAFSNSIDKNQEDLVFSKLENTKDKQKYNSLAQQELSLAEISNDSSYWSSKLKQVLPQKLKERNNKKSNSHKKNISSLDSTLANLNTRAEIATNAYSRKGQRNYIQVEKKQKEEVKRDLNSQASQTEITTEQKKDQIKVNNEIIEKTEYYNEDILEGVLKPIWFQDNLFLIRAVYAGTKTLYQVIQIDLEKLDQWVKKTASDLLPNISILKISPEDVNYKEDNPQRLEQLALLPIFINPHFIPSKKSLHFKWTPTTISIVSVWVCIFLLTLIIIILIKSILNLSIRRGDFASAVTHELRTPLTTFKMYTELLDEGMVSSEEKKKDYYRILRSESDRLQGLVENVLTFASIEKGNRGFSKSEFKLVDLIEKITLRAKERISKSSLKLSIRLDESLEDNIILTDQNVVEQIIFNLIENACKYATHENAEATMEIIKQGNHFHFNIFDNGPGVLNEHRKKLFSPFFKSDRDAANTSNGVGLGLALSRQIARQLGGDLKLNKSKVGASFTLILNN